VSLHAGGDTVETEREGNSERQHEPSADGGGGETKVGGEINDFPTVYTRNEEHNKHS